MKHLCLFFYCLIAVHCFSQSNNAIELVIEPNVLNRIYINEKTEFKSFLINNSDEKYFVPARNLTEYPKSFVWDDYDLFDPDGNEIVMRSAPGGSGQGTSHPAKLISENGGKIPGRSFFYTFTTPGKYKLVLKYYLNKDHKPSNSTTSYKSFEAKTEIIFDVFDRSPIPFERKEIDFETYKKQPQISDFSKTNDSTNVFNLMVTDATESQLNAIAKFNNLRGLSIYSKELDQLPDAVYELELFELTLSLTNEDPSMTIDLTKISRFKDLRTLKIIVNNKATLIDDFSVFENLQELHLIGIKNTTTIHALPKKELSKLVFRNLGGLQGLNGDFSGFTKLGSLSLIQIQNFSLPMKFSGNIWELELNHGPFSDFPDLSELSLARIKFYSFTGASLPANFQASLKPGAQVTFPKEMFNSKDYKQLKKAGFKVFPVSK